MNENENLQPVEKLTPFTRMIMTIGTLPSSFYSSMTYYESMVWLYEYLKNEVIPTVNNNGEAVEELQQAYTTLENYISTYFDNLDVQEEVNKKLDEMALDGTITNLIKEYIDPLYQQYETSINQIVQAQNTVISNINNKVDAATNINPLVANELSDMTDTTRIYVLTTDGNWYYYDGDSWESGGAYQSPVETFDTTLTVSEGVADSKSIGDRINQDYKKYNLINTNNMQSNKIYQADGSITDQANWYILDDVLFAKAGQTLRLQYTDGEGKQIIGYIGYIVSTDAYGSFVSRIDASRNQALYTFANDTFFKLNLSTSTTYTNISQYFCYFDEIEPEYISNNSYVNKNDLTKVNKIIEDNTHQYNYFDINNAIINMSMTSDGFYNYANNSLFVTNLIKVESGDVLTSTTFNTTYPTHNFSQVLKYDENKHFTARASVGGLTYTADFDGYVKFNMSKSTSETSDDIGSSLVISKNESVSQFYPFRKYVINPDINKIKIEKINSTNYTITFGKFNVTLFKTVSSLTNSNNWNIKEIKNGLNTLVPAGTDILGPVKINNNSDYIGGMHGDEITNDLTVTINGTAYNETELADITYLTGDSLNVTMKSTCYDQQLGDQAFDRYVVIDFTPNKMHITNSFKALKNLTLNVATNGGLIACANPIIKNITMNNSYFASAPTTYANNDSKYNTNATINTIYGSITMNNIKGYENANYNGYLQVYVNETPVRNKVYFMIYKPGNYNISIGDIISGEFEYILS